MKFHLSMVQKQLMVCSACPHGIVEDNVLVCSANGWAVDLFGKCPLGKWEANVMRFDSRTQTVWLPKTDVSQEAALDAKFERIPGTLRWKVPQPSLLDKISSFVVATTSGKASEATIEKRKLACFGNENTPACPALAVDGERRYCAACSCGKWLLSDLNGIVPKLEWEKLRCPLKRF